jgi:hypothetical protein
MTGLGLTWSPVQHREVLEPVFQDRTHPLDHDHHINVTGPRNSVPEESGPLLHQGPVETTYCASSDHNDRTRAVVSVSLWHRVLSGRPARPRPWGDDQTHPLRVRSHRPQSPVPLKLILLFSNFSTLAPKC